MSRRQKILVIGGLAVLAMLYIGALANPSGSGSGDPDNDRPGIIRLLGRWFGGSDAVDPADLTADCLDQTPNPSATPAPPAPTPSPTASATPAPAGGRRLLVRGTCAVHVPASETRVRNVQLKATDAVTVSARAPQGEDVVKDEIGAGADPVDRGGRQGRRHHARLSRRKDLRRHDGEGVSSWASYAYRSSSSPSWRPVWSSWWNWDPRC